MDSAFSSVTPSSINFWRCSKTVVTLGQKSFQTAQALGLL